MLWALILIGWTEGSSMFDAGRWVRIAHAAYRMRRRAGQVARPTIPATFRSCRYRHAVTPQGRTKAPLVPVEVEIPWVYDDVRYDSGAHLEVPLEVYLKWRGVGFIVRAEGTVAQRRRDRGCGKKRRA